MVGRRSRRRHRRDKLPATTTAVAAHSFKCFSKSATTACCSCNCCCCCCCVFYLGQPRSLLPCKQLKWPDKYWSLDFFKVFCQNGNHHTTAAFRETVRLLEPAAAAVARNKSKETKAAYHRHFFFLPLLPVQKGRKSYFT